MSKFKAGNVSRLRSAITPRGALVESGTVGSMVFVRTTEQIYVVHRDWIPALDPMSVARVRELYGFGDLSMDELAGMFDTSQQTILQVINGAGRFSGLPRVVRPYRYSPRESAPC